MISSGKPSNCKKMFTDKVSEADVLGYYLGITSIPCLIVSPFRKDSKPSLGFYSPNGIDVNYIDFGDKEDRGSMITFLMKLWNLDYNSTIDKIVKEVVKGKHIECNVSSVNPTTPNVTVNTGNKELKCTIREWKSYDIEYWASYGVTLEWLKWANVYPVSYKFIIKDGKEMIFRADKYCYAFVEHKEGRTTMKFYQPYNAGEYKWQNSHDKSVLGLWSKLPERGKAVCICSSVKDALCLMSNLYIHCICLQGEGYPISDTAVKELKRRFTDVYCCLDNDLEGKKDALKLSEEHNFINVVIPEFPEGKDISDYYKAYGKETFKTFFRKLFIEAREEWYNELPF
jgi:hypothetical protein